MIAHIANALLLACTPPAQDNLPPMIRPVPAAPAGPQNQAPAPAAPANAEPPRSTSPAPPTVVPGPYVPDITITARAHPDPGDPLQRINEDTYALTQKVDKAIVAPASRVYVRIVPHPIRDGARNFSHNLREPVVFLNYLLQLKPGKAAETLGRFAINTTLGIGGLFDVAKRCPFNLPWRPNGFSDTLGRYGVKPGPFVFLPIIGPTTVRDLAGGALDRVMMPLSVGGPLKTPEYGAASGVMGALDRRAGLDGTLQAEGATVNGGYRVRRDAYLHKREREIDGIKGGKDAKSERRNRCSRLH